MVNDTLEVNGQSIELDTTSSGHYYIPLKECEVKVEKVHIITEMKTVKEKEKAIKKLHRQFGHPSAKSLKEILNNADAIDKECTQIIENINRNCEVCQRFKKTPARPVVSLSLAKQFNDVVAMDLKKFKDEIYFIHFSDMHTRFHKSKVIRRKTPKNIIDSIATEWIATGFGPPKKFLVDNGGEFDNEEYREMSEQFNVEICTTAAYSPWSNGICERNHYIVDTCVQKMMEDDPTMSLEVALAWAVNAKNSMQNHLGFSPIQLVVGNNPNLPSVLYNQLPAHEEVKVSETVLKHLNALHSARRAFIKAESSERIKRALKHNVRVSEEVFFPGDKVFYKRDDSNRWRGPGKIVGQDGKVLFIRHGSQLVRVATCRAVKLDYSRQKEENDIETNIPSEQQVRKEDNIQNEADQENDQENTDDDRRHAEENNDIANGDQNLDIETQRIEANSENDTNYHNIQQNEKPRIPKAQENIRYREKQDENWIYAKVISRGGKSTGRNKYYVNLIHENDNKMLGVHLDRFEYEIVKDNSLPTIENTENNLQFQEDNEEEVNITYVPVGDHWRPEVIKAKENEIDNWKNFNVFTEVEDKGQKTISTRWVITQKTIDEDNHVKARLVVRGFEEEEHVQSDSPTAAKSTLRLVIALAANEEWDLETIDIKAAFLQGKGVDRDIYVVPPKEIKEEGVIWKLNKVAYGLGDASRNWFFSVKEDLTKLNCKQSKLDHALFRWYNRGRLEGVFVMHVDDFLFCGTTEFNKNVIEKISKKYKVGKRSVNHFKYVGLNMAKNEHGIYVDQETYADELEEIHIPIHRKGDKQSPLTTNERKQMMTIAGQLNWLATQTRPDLSYDALELNISKKEPTIENLIKANKAVRQAKQKPSGILFTKLGNSKNLTIKVFSDAAWGNLPDGTSSGQGHIIFLSGDQNSCPLSWTSNKIKRKVSSTLAAETLALHDALDEAIYLNGILSETLFDTKQGKINISASIDNKSLMENIESTKQVHEKRLRINIAEIRRMKEQKEVSSIKWVDTRQQLADVLTKRGVDAQPLLDTLRTGKGVSK